MAAARGPHVVKVVAHCRRCDGWLLSPQSVERGVGPTCAIHERVEQRGIGTSPELTLFDGY